MRHTRTLVVLTAAGALTLSAPSHALTLPLANASFESPPIADPGTNDPRDYVLPFISDWVEEGPITTEQGFTGRLDTGVFLNATVIVEGDIAIPPIPNATGNQLAYLRHNSAAGVGEEQEVAIRQETTTLFELDTDYAFSLAIGASILQPPATDDPVNNPSTVVMAIGFDDPANPGDFIPVAQRVVNADELDPFIALRDFTVTADAAAIGGVWAGSAPVGNEIVVRVSQIGGITGSFNLDDARLAVPVVGDTDLDGDIDDADLGTALSNFSGPSTGGGLTPADGDTDGDGDIDDADLGNLIANFTGPANFPQATPIPGPVPEPASLTLLGLSMAACLRRRR